MVARFLWCRRPFAALACAASTSCSAIVDSLAHDERPIPNAVDQPPVQREAVVAALLPQIDASGLFRFPTPNVPSGEMSLDTARAQAGEFLFYALNISVIRGGVEGQRGAFIDLPTLTPCNRAQLARSVYERPPDSLPAVVRLQLGSHWLLPFCGTRRTPEVVVAVVTRGNNARYRNNQSVGDTVGQSFAFRVTGIPWEWKVEHMVTPEEAVNEVYAVTGLRAEQLPELVTASQINGRAARFVLCPVWRVVLERPVRMAALYSLRRLDLSEVFVGDSDCPGIIGRTILLTPWAQQPPPREFILFVPDSTATNGLRRVVYTVSYRAPVSFETVVIER